MGKSRNSVRAKLFILGLSSVVVTAGVGSAAATTATIATTPLASDVAPLPASLESKFFYRILGLHLGL